MKGPAQPAKCCPTGPAMLNPVSTDLWFQSRTNTRRSHCEGLQPLGQVRKTCKASRGLCPHPSHFPTSHLLLSFRLKLAGDLQASVERLGQLNQHRSCGYRLGLGRMTLRLQHPMFDDAAMGRLERHPKLTWHRPCHTNSAAQSSRIRGQSLCISNKTIKDHRLGREEDGSVWTRQQ